MLRELRNLVLLLTAEFPAYEFGTQRTWNGVSLVAICRDGADRAGTYAVITSDFIEMRHVLSSRQSGLPPAPPAARTATGPPKGIPLASYLTELDERKCELEDENPGWQIWYVPHTDRTVTWCARPRPLLNTDSPEQLQQLIDQARDESDSPVPIWKASHERPENPG